MARRSMSALARGQVVHGFEVVRSDRVAEKNLTCVELRHCTTGARHLHVGCDDSNNTFAVAFLTVPSDSTGVAHILEHTALCGSKRYPVRDPFFNMIKRSLNTFMNAFTGADYTMYPFSSQNPTDFRNLLSVYLDAAFHPNLNRLDFLQEGHRLEFDSKTGKLVRTGVVFNEMHGALADSSSLFREQMSAAIYPNTTYGQNSGGDPLFIPDLTWKGLRDFHALHYHPSNAFFYTYGDMPLESHLEVINNTLKEWKRSADPAPAVSMQKLFDKPVEIVTKGPPSPGVAVEEQYKSALVWLLPDESTDISTSLCMNLLSELLLSGPSAPMYRALLETRMGSGFAPMTGFEGQNRQPTFGVGLSGMTKEDAARVPEVVMQVLETCRKEGFPAERIESILHQLELSHKHVESGYGLHAGMTALNRWMLGGDPIESLRFDKYMEQLRKQVAEGRLQELIETRLLKNPHRLWARQEPDETYTETLKSKERAHLDQVESKLTAAEKTEIQTDATTLLEHQNAPPNVDCLPTLSEKDIPLKKPVVVVESRAKTRFTSQPTNGVTYFYSVIDLTGIPEHLVVSLPLWCSLVTSQGAAGKDHREFSQEIDLYTGGISVSTSLSSHPYDLSRFQMTLHVSSHCLDRNAGRMMSLIERLLQAADWSDRENVAALLEQSASGTLEGLTQYGNSYASKAASSVFGRVQQLEEQLGGMSQVSFISKLAEDPEAVLDKLLADFAEIEAFVRSKSRSARVQVNAQNPSSVVEESANKWWGAALDSSRFVYSDQRLATPPPKSQKLFYPIPAAVNFVARAVSTRLPYMHPDLAALSVGAKVMSSCFLHREIREKGGAYGGGCSVSADGVLSMSSYRAPQLYRTVNTFEQGINWLFMPEAFSDRDVLEAKLSVFSGIDRPVPPGSRAVGELYTAITHEMRQEKRESLLAVDRNKILKAFSDHVLPNFVGDQAVTSIAALGNEHEVEQGWEKRTLLENKGKK